MVLLKNLSHLHKKPLFLAHCFLTIVKPSFHSQRVSKTVNVDFNLLKKLLAKELDVKQEKQ